MPKSMLDQIELVNSLNQLPDVPKSVIAQNLSNSELGMLIRTAKSSKSFFQPILDVRKFLYYLVRGNHDVIQEMLLNDPWILLQRGNVTDCSGRTFENISGFEYALWALDKHMWALMLDCLPINGGASQQVLEQLRIQYNEFNTNTKKVTYRLNGKTIVEKHFDFENTIIKELRKQINLTNTTEPDEWEEFVEKQWREGVGGAQRLLPMHVVDEYCSNEPFDPEPKFTAQPKSSRKFLNVKTKKYESWFDDDSKMGSEFAIYKGRNGPLSMCSGVYWFGAQYDLDALMALCKIRTKDFSDLGSQLNEQMTLVNHPPWF